MKKVAIYQNTISRGGRIRVIAYMTECLNELGIVPDWISFRNGFDNSDLESMHSVPINANFKIIDSFNKKDFNNSIFEIKYNKNYDNYVKKNLKNIIDFVNFIKSIYS